MQTPLIHESVRNPNILAVGHLITGNLKIISDSRILCKSPKYKFPSRIDF